jgi:hypothetical protein
MSKQVDWYELGIYENGRWSYSGRYGEPMDVVVAATFRLGRALFAEPNETNGSWRIADAETGETVAGARLMSHAPKGPLRRWRGLTWIGWLNFLLLRWFLFRLSYNVEDDGSISGYGVRFIPSWRW